MSVKRSQKSLTRYWRNDTDWEEVCQTLRPRHYNIKRKRNCENKHGETANFMNNFVQKTNATILNAFYTNFATEFFHTVFTRRSVCEWTSRRDQKVIFVKSPTSCPLVSNLEQICRWNFSCRVDLKCHQSCLVAQKIGFFFLFVFSIFFSFYWLTFERLKPWSRNLAHFLWIISSRIPCLQFLIIFFRSKVIHRFVPKMGQIWHAGMFFFF